MALDSWLQFRNAPQHVYVNPEHADQLYREVAAPTSTRAARQAKAQSLLSVKTASGTTETMSTRA
jgi:hypothetical protein